MLVDVDLSDDLAVDAYGLYADRPVGRFAYLPERRELWLEQVLLGDALNVEELTTAVDAVSGLADSEDDRLQAAHGGRRYQGPAARLIRSAADEVGQHRERLLVRRRPGRTSQRFQTPVSGSIDCTAVLGRTI